MRRLFALGLCSLVLACSNDHGLDVDSGSQSPDTGPIGSEDGGVGVCPPDINPWNPMDPHSLCAPEGRRCTSGGSDVCGSFMSCSCESGHWNCAVAEADPVCWCGRQPAPGDRCSMEGMACGECCPTAGGTGWPAMSCVGGHWAPSACPDIVCPPVEAPSCAVDTHALLGTSCTTTDAECGDPCCGNAVVCQGGTWQPGPEADCFACTSYACGDGLCRADQTCVSDCGPTGTPMPRCAPRDASCHDCSCITTAAGQQCQMIDGHPYVTSFCF